MHTVGAADPRSEVMEGTQKLVTSFPGVNPRGTFLQVAHSMNFRHNLLPMQSLQPTGYLDYKEQSLSELTTLQLLNRMGPYARESQMEAQASN